MRRLRYAALFLLLLAVPAAAQGLSDQMIGEYLAGKNAPGGDFSWTDVFACIPPVRRGPGDKTLFFTLGGMYIKKIGNTDFLTSNVKADFRYDDDITELELYYDAYYTEVKERITEKKQSGLFRLDHLIVPRIEAFLYSKSESNEITRILHRNNSGAGLKLVLVRNDYWKVDISGAPIHQYEHIMNTDPADQWRWSVRFKTTVTPIGFVSLRYVFFYIPKIDESAVYRFSHDVNMSIAVYKNLSLSVAYLHEYNNNPAPGVKNVDETVTAQISINL